MNGGRFDRRRFLKVMGLSGVAIAASGAAAATQRAPTRKELEVYYTLLWAEFQHLAEEMGVEKFDPITAHGYGAEGTGNYDQIMTALGESRPSSRALTVLSAAGLASGDVR